MTLFRLLLAYLSDIFELLNELNRKMQGSDNNVITHTDTVKGITMQFHRYSEVLVTVNDKTILLCIKTDS